MVADLPSIRNGRKYAKTVLILFLIQAENVVCWNIIKLTKLNEMSYGHFVDTFFIARINLLSSFQNICYFLLGVIVIFSQISYYFIIFFQAYHLKKILQYIRCSVLTLHHMWCIIVAKHMKRQILQRNVFHFEKQGNYKFFWRLCYERTI